MITRAFDAADGIIFVTASGFWTEAEIDEHYERLRVLIAARRAAGEPVRVLTDLREAFRQTPELEAHALEQMKRTYRDGDRVAILTSGEVDQALVRSLLGDLKISTFASALPAEMWLMLG